ncbi:transposase [Nonomuraea sp. NPDC048916]|uniref:transposase n=1 Tax=Nonomuraea sp. NPDC048916 TaxID=3154232 RepID=UPI0033E0AC15
MAGTTRRRFDPEFRAGAVRIVRETGKPVAHVARDLGINEHTLYNWVQMDRLAEGRPATAEARLKIATWIADFYNVKRRHGAFDPPFWDEPEAD